MEYDTMSKALRLAKRLPTGTYRQRLSLALKVEHLRNRLITVIDINWLKLYYPHVNLSLIRTLYKSDRFVITGGYYLSIEHYVRPRTEQEDNYCIGIMIQSEINSGINPKLD